MSQPKKSTIEVRGVAITVLSQADEDCISHKDSAFGFTSWISSEFKLYLIKEFQRLKSDENRRLSLAWNLNSTRTKLNYHIHTGRIRQLAERYAPPLRQLTGDLTALATKVSRHLERMGFNP